MSELALVLALEVALEPAFALALELVVKKSIQMAKKILFSCQHPDGEGKTDRKIRPKTGHENSKNDPLREVPGNGSF